MQLEDITVLVRDKSLTIQGMIPPQDLDFEASIEHNQVGSWKLALPLDHPMAPVLRTPGSGLVVVGPDGAEMFSGPTSKPELSATPDDPGGTVKFEGLTDSVVLADSLAFPSPSVPADQQGQANDVRTGPSETLMHAYVNANIGPSATTARRKAGLIMGDDQARGSVVKKAPRFQVLGELLTELAIEADYGLGFHVIQRGTDLVFETYQINDKTAEIRLDALNGTLSGQRVATTPPAITAAIVAGQGVGVDRQIREYTTPESLAAAAEWDRRIEKFIDQRQTNDWAELEKAAMEPLIEGGFSGLAVQAVPADDTAMTFGTDWFLGDRVTVVVEGQELSVDVTGFVFKADKEGFRLGAIVGNPSGFQSPAAATAQKMTKVEKRVSALERNVQAFAAGAGPGDPGDPPDPTSWGALKIADTTRNNTASVTADPTLSIADIAGGNYLFDALIVYSADSAADFKGAFSGSIGISNIVHLNLREQATGAEFGVNENGAQFTAAGQGVGAKRAMQITGSFVNAGAAQSFGLSWAQRFAHASNVTVHRGSFLRIQKV